MTVITVKYDENSHEAYKITVKRQSMLGDVTAAIFRMDGSSAYLSSAECSGEFLSEAMEHVEELPFVQGVTIDEYTEDQA